MPTAFWAASVLLLLVTGTGSAVPLQSTASSPRSRPIVRLASGMELSWVERKGHTILQLTRPRTEGTHERHVSSVVLERDADVAEDASLLDLQVLGEAKTSAVIIADSYPSKPGPMSYCQAGQERFVRIITLSGAEPHESEHFKLESCRENLELASPGVTWDAGAALLTISWLNSSSGPESRRYRIDGEGNARLQEPSP